MLRFREWLVAHRPLFAILLVEFYLIGILKGKGIGAQREDPDCYAYPQCEDPK